ncbi:uncharacterized protein BDR25DRAFT_301327 [Lindgomyces ingoldianus]|uniref:Uncharacterized protein n=1 Tax=Lindgomyces ingoldianus TaxID=673940 RepID=A0ACB6R871_9PLEO|nr:uncharacterized protein BDR25DRAFT_301327 [Lindgomyces ingoldianus]KAF2474651.1 hypothetical protein BDR25DRAFT_301327 [Lindgomyces ingoldianus]
MTKPLPHLSNVLHVILDWDGTLTKNDTLNSLVEIAKNAKPDTFIPTTWNLICRAYLTDYEKALQEHATLPSNVFEERKLLKKIEAVEQASINRLNDSGIFKDITAEQLAVGAQRAFESRTVELREGANEFFRYIKERMDRQKDDIDIVSILSVNWSQRFIAGCLQAASSALEPQTPTRESMLEDEIDRRYGLTRNSELQNILTNKAPKYMAESSAPDFVRIYANELQGIEDGLPSTGFIASEGDHKIICSHDKVTYLHRLQKMSPCTMKPIPIVYVGDSWTDFECLLAADLGICIRDDPMTSSQRRLEDSLQRLGIACPYLKEYKEIDEWGIVWAHDFFEIKEWVEIIESKAVAMASSTEK